MNEVLRVNKKNGKISIKKGNLTADEAIDKLEVELFSKGIIPNFDYVHTFTPGLYTREITMPKGTMVTSECHKTTHQFILSDGICSVWSDMDKEQLLQSPYRAITMANTRRVLYMHTTCVWTTVHPNPENKSLEELEEELFDSRRNPLLEQMFKDLVPYVDELLKLKNEQS